MFVEGEFLDTVIGIPDSRTEIVMLRPPDGGTRLELSSFVRPDHEPGSPAAMANELGLRNVASRSTTCRRGRPAGRGRLRPGRRHRPVRGHLAHGLRARTGGHHRVPGRAARLTVAVAQPVTGLPGPAHLDDLVKTTTAAPFAGANIRGPPMWRCLSTRRPTGPALELAERRRPEALHGDEMNSCAGPRPTSGLTRCPACAPPIRGNPAHDETSITAAPCDQGDPAATGRQA